MRRLASAAKYLENLRPEKCLSVAGDADWLQSVGVGAGRVGRRVLVLGAVVSSTAFRFNEADHVYTDLSGRPIISVTQLLKKAGFINDQWFTAGGKERGTAVHELCADYCMGALTDLPGLVSPYRGYVLGWAEAMTLLQHDWDVIEEGLKHPTFNLAGKPDRGGRVFGVPSCVEIKTGAKEPWHSLQLALQCLLLESRLNWPSEKIDRYAVYLKANGKFGAQQFKDAKDFAVARSLIQRFA